MDGQLFNKLKDASQADNLVDLSNEDLMRRRKTVVELSKSKQDQHDLIAYDKELEKVNKEIERRGLIL